MTAPGQRSRGDAIVTGRAGAGDRCQVQQLRLSSNAREGACQVVSAAQEGS